MGENKSTSWRFDDRRRYALHHSPTHHPLPSHLEAKCGQGLGRNNIQPKQLEEGWAWRWRRNNMKRIHQSTCIFNIIAFGDIVRSDQHSELLIVIRLGCRGLARQLAKRRLAASSGQVLYLLRNNLLVKQFHDVIFIIISNKNLSVCYTDL